MRIFFKGLARCERGVALVEYAMLIALLAVALTTTFIALGSSVLSQYDKVEQDYTDAVR